MLFDGKKRLGTKFVILFLIGILFISFVSANLGVGVGGKIGIDLVPEVQINYSSVNVNNSDYWVGLGGYNATQMENSNGLLNILESWLKSLFYTETEIDTNFVPYNGATSNVDLGIYNITNYSKHEDGTAQGQMAFWDAVAGKWVKTETSELFWDDVNKRFGIGKATPDVKLDVDGTIRSTGLASPTTGVGLELRNGGTYSSVLSYNRDSTTYLPLYLEGSSLSFREAGSPVMTIDDGKVGIGIATPLNELHVVGTSRINDLTIKKTDGVINDFLYPTNYALRFTEVGSFRPGFILTGSTFSNLPGRVVFRHGVSGTRFEYADGSSNTEQMRITKEGNVGIGTTSPTEELTVAGDIHLQNDSDKIYLGQAKDVSIEMNGSTFNILNEVGSIIFNFQSFLKYVFDSDVEIQGDLNVVGNQNLTGNFTGNQIYVQACYHNHTATLLDFAVSNLFYNMTFDIVDQSNGFHNISQHELVCDVAGLYAVNHMAIGDGQNNHKYILRVAVNGIGEECTGVRKQMAVGGDITTMSGTGIIRLEVGDIVQLQVADDGGTGTGNYYGMNLNLVRIGN